MEAKVDLNSFGGGLGGTLLERDVCVSFVYVPAILVLKHPSGGSQQNAQLMVYTQLKDNLYFKLTHVCQLELTGSFAINVIDSLIIVHHQATKVSMVFDICLGTEMRDGVCCVYPATKPASIRPYNLEEPLVAASSAGAKPPGDRAPSVTSKMPCQLYAPTWVVFQPFVIIDALLGCLWMLHIDLPAFAATFTDSLQLVTCLLNRRQGKALVMQTVRSVTEKKALYVLSSVFDRINVGYRRHLDAINCHAVADACVLTAPTNPLLLPSSTPSNILHSLSPAVVVEVVDLYSNILSPLMEKAYALGKPEDAASEQPKTAISCEKVSCEVDAEKTREMTEAVNYMVSVTLEYMRSIVSAGIPVPEFLHQLIVNALLNTEKFFQLHQLLQYHVIPDSKPLACVLLSRAGVYPACEQLSIDMLARLQCASDEVIEVLLANQQITLALRYARANGIEEKVSCRKFLEAAKNTGDDAIFHATFIHFSLRNARLGHTRPIGEGDHCEVYVKHFKKLFGEVPDYSTSLTT